jgi:hypothetical protein
MSYCCTPSGPKSGPILYRHDLAAIDVQVAPDGRTIGMATPVGATAGGVAIWRLTVGGAGVLGRWIVVGREFWPEK